MPLLIVLLSLLAAAVAGALALVASGTAAAVIAFVAVLALGAYGGLFAFGLVRRAIVLGMVVLLLVGSGAGGLTGVPPHLRRGR